MIFCAELGGGQGRAEGWTAIFPEVKVEYMTIEAQVGGCIARKDKGMGGDELFLKECLSNDQNIQWRLDDQGRFHSKVNDTECMQVGEAPALFVGPGALRQGTDLFVKACEGPRKPTFQNLNFPVISSSDISYMVTAVVALESRPDLCVVHFAADPTINESRIMLVDCASLGGDRGKGWNIGAPCRHLPACTSDALTTLPSGVQ